jgi:hypothetical protein
MKEKWTRWGIGKMREGSGTGIPLRWSHRSPRR